MIAAEGVLAIGEASLRAAPALLAVLALHRWMDAWTTAVTRRAVLLAAVLTVPALVPLGESLPGVAILPAGAPRTAISPGVHPAASSLDAVVAGAATIWLIGVGVMLIRLLGGLVQVHRHAARAAPLVQPAWLADRDGMAAALGLRRPPELRVGWSECVPHALGFARPVIVLPSSATSWSPGRRQAVLAHEIAHLARREPVARVAAELVRAIHWFDPVLRAAIARFRIEGEMAADEAATSLGLDADDYARHLVALARDRRAHIRPGPMPAFSAPGDLERRIQRVLARNPPKRMRRAIRWAIPAVTIGFVVLAAVPRLAAPKHPLHERLSQHYGIAPALAERILAAAEREGVAPRVAFGLVAEESGFDSTKTSLHGAVGLTQMLPATAQVVRPGISHEDLRSDSVNLRIGFRYLRSQIEREGGSIVNGLVGYHLGPRRLDTLRRRGEPVPLEYARRVLTSAD